MNYPPLVIYKSQEEYKKHYIEKYCDKNNRIVTHDGIMITFYEDKFEHVFFESLNHKKADKSIFSRKRAERIDWIEAVLKDETAELYFGWDKKSKSVDYKRRVSIINSDNYVVILYIKSSNQAKFMTAYLADSPNTATNIRSMPKWKM